MRSDAAGSSPLLDAVAALAADLEAAGHSPVLVGGMALVILGSDRATFDFDLVVSADTMMSDDLVALMYRRHFELVTKYRATRAVQRTVDSLKVAQLKVRTEKPITLPFFNWKTRLRVDLMRDFPVPANSLLQRSILLDLHSGSLRIASIEDLLQLKEMAAQGRTSAKDAQDLEFLKTLKSR